MNIEYINSKNMNNIERHAGKSERKDGVTEIEVPLAPDNENNKEFQLTKNQWKWDYQLMFKKENPEMTPLERKERVQEEMRRINDLINELKRDFPEFSDDHKDIIKYRAQLRALYELIN